MKRFFHWLFTQVLDPNDSTRKWIVDCGNYYVGFCKNFWLKKNAIKFAALREEMFVTVINEMTGERIKIRENPDKILDIRNENGGPTTESLNA